MRKRRSKAGETLTETLCAVLVTGLAVALLAAMISASSRLDLKTDRTAAELYECVSQAESQTSGTKENGTVSVEVAGESRPPLDVTFYGIAEQAVSYRAAEASTP